MKGRIMQAIVLFLIVLLILVGFVLIGTSEQELVSNPGMDARTAGCEPGQHVIVDGNGVAHCEN